MTESSGLVRTGWASSVTVGGYNNDGFEDIFITYYGQNVLYRNNGDGTFTDVTEAGRPLVCGEEPRWGSGCTFLDYDRDGHLDLFVANYRRPAPGPSAQAGRKSILQLQRCSRKLRSARPAHAAQLSLSQPRRRHFSRCDRKRAGIAKTRQRTYSMTAVAADFDGDGWTDLYVASDSTPSLLFRNNHDGTFTEEGVASRRGPQ